MKAEVRKTLIGKEEIDEVVVRHNNTLIFIKEDSEQDGLDIDVFNDEDCKFITSHFISYDEVEGL